MSKHTTMAGFKRCIMCGDNKFVTTFSKYGYTTKKGTKSVRFESRCKLCNKERIRKRRTNPEKAAMDKASSLVWKRKNKDKLVEYRKVRQQDPDHRANKAKAQRQRKARMRSGSNNKDPAITAIYQMAMDIEKKLAACVECDDPLEMKMHVDHIIPLTLGGKHVASNLQVLSAKQNLKKGGRPA